MKKLLSTLLMTGLATTSQAVTINDIGVVGTIDAGTQSADVADVADWGQHLLDVVGASVSLTEDGNLPTDTVTEIYTTSAVDYVGLLGAGTRIDGATPDISSFDWVLGKYDGQNAGYVMFNVADYLGDVGGLNIPEFSFSIWGDNAEQYQLSNVTGFSEVPVPAAAWFFGSAMLGLAGVARKRNHT